MSLGNPDRPIGGLSVRRPPGVELRPLARDDLADALALALECHGRDGEPDDGHRAAYDAYLNDPDAAPFLALADGEPAGLVLFDFRRRLNRATFEGRVELLFVRERYRGRGIGRALLNAATEEWRLRQGHALVLEVPDDATAARALAASAGFVERERVWQLAPLPGSAPASPAEVRPIEHGDADAVTRLLAELGRPAVPPERVAAIERTFADHLRRADRVSFVALLDGAPAGVIVSDLRRRFDRLRPQLWISELVVAEARRGGGIGRQLLAAALAAAREADADRAALAAPATRAACERLVGASGFAPRGDLFVLER